MAELLFVTWDGGGNVPPALGIGAELASRGHRVRFVGHAGQAGQVESAGFAFTPYETARPFSSTADNSPFALIATFGDRAMGQDALNELRRSPADVVVVDCLLFGVMDVLAREGREYVVLEHLYDEYLMKRWLRGPMGIGMAVKRFKPRALLDRARLRLIASSAELDPGSGDQPANVVYTGPVVTATPAAPGAPTVLVSLSTFNFRGQAKSLQNILEAVGELPVRAVVTTGPSIDPADLVAPPNAEVHSWVSHAELLPDVSVVVGHGGHATTMAALAHDIPLVVMPMHPGLDQSIVGRSVEQAGAGRLLPKKADPARIRRAVEELLADGPHRAAAARLGAAIRDGRGAETAADRIESLVRNGVAPS